MTPVLLPALLWSLSLSAADIEWRGGAGDNFATVQNWHLPPDIPPDTKPEDREAFRRVPGPNDHAVIPAGVSVQVSTTVVVQRATISGTLLVEGTAAFFRALHSDQPVMNAFGAVEVRDGGNFEAGNPSTFSGPLRVESGGSVDVGAATLSRVTLVGSIPQGGKSTSLMARTNEADPLVVEDLLELDGESGSQVMLNGFITAKKAATWRNCRVNADHVTFGGGATPSELRLLEGDEQTVWAMEREGEMVFRKQARLRHGTGRHIFAGTITFNHGSPGIPAPPANAGPIIFRGGRQTFFSRGFVEGDPNPTPELHPPLRFEEDAEVVFQGTTAGDFTHLRTAPGLDGSTQMIEFGGDTVVEVAGPVVAAGLIMDENAQLVVRSGKRLQLSNPDGVALFSLRGGTVTLESRLVGDEPFTVETNATFRVGRPVPATGFVPVPKLVGNVVVRAGGRLEFVGPTNSTHRNPDFSGECRVLPGGQMTVQDGFGPSGGLLRVVNFGAITALPAPEPRAEDFLPGAFVAHTLINAGSMTVEPGATLQVQEGEHFRGGSLEVRERAGLAVVGQGLNDQVVWLDLDGSPQTNLIGKLFHLRASTQVSFAADSRLEILSQGAYGRPFRNGQFRDVPGGVRLEVPLAVDHVVLGRFDGQIPQIRFGEGAFPDGIGLRIGKRLEWVGGAFVGNGSGTNLSTANVELPAGSEAFISRPPVGFGTIGENYVLHRGITCQVRGRLTIDSVRALVSEDVSSSFVFHPGSDVEIKALTSQVGMTTARVFNRTTVRKTGPARCIFNGLWENLGEGRLQVEEGEVLTQDATLVGDNYQTSVSGAKFAVGNGTTLRDFTSTGGTFSVTGETRFEGNCFFDFLELGNRISSEIQLFIQPVERPGLNRGGIQRAALQASVVTVLKGMKWVSNGIKMSGGSKLVLGPDSQNHFESALATSPAGIFDSGRIENHGTTTLRGNNTSRFQADSGTTVENFGTFTFDTPEGGIVFPGGFDGRVSSLKFINRAQVRIKPPPLNDRQFEMAFEFENAEGGRLEVEQPPEPPNRAIGRTGSPRAHADPPLRKIVFKNRFFLLAGLCDLRRADVVFQRTFELRDGRLLLGGPGSGVFKDTLNTQGGLLRFEDSALGTFERLTTFRNGAGLFVGPDSELALPNDLNLTTGARLTGRGTIVGNIACPSGIISPGDDELTFNGRGRLTLRGSLVCDVGATLEMDVPSAPGLPTDHLVVAAHNGEGGNIKVAGKLRVNAFVNSDALNLDFIPIISYQHQFVGDFPIFEGGEIREGVHFTLLHKDGQREFGVVAVTDVSANLALTGEVPLTASTGSELTSTYTVENKGPDEAPSPKLEVTLPANATFVSSDPAGTVVNGKLTVNLPSLAKDAKATVTVKLKAPDAAASLAATATVSSSRRDPAPENNTTSSVTAVFPGGEFKVAKFELNGAGKLKLTFETLPGVRYRLERSTDLEVWTPVQDFLGDGTALEVDNLGGNGGQPEFFRLSVVR